MALHGQQDLQSSAEELHHPEHQTSQQTGVNYPVDSTHSVSAPSSISLVDETNDGLSRSNSHNKKAAAHEVKNVTSDAEDDGEIVSLPSWCPFWLRRITLGTFCCFFLCCTVALPILLFSSQKFEGLLDFHTSYTKDISTLWRIGPTGVVTVAAVMWARVELQTLRYFPWVTIQPGQAASQNHYALDYTAMIPTTVLLRSFRNKHYFVFVISLVSIFLKALVVLSAGLFYIQHIRVERPIDIELLDSFNLNATTESDLGIASRHSSYNVARAIRDFGIPYPFGVTTAGAYQTFQQTGQSDQRGTLDSPVKSVVDGIFVDVDCLQLESYTVQGVLGTRTLGQVPVTDVGFDLKFENCEDSINIVQTFYNSGKPNAWLISPLTNLSTEANDHGASRGNTRPCASLPQQHEQFIYSGTLLESSVVQNKSIPPVISTAAVLCAPRTWLSKVEVIDDGINPQVTVLEEQANVPVGTDIWTLVAYCFPRRIGGWLWRNEDNSGGGAGIGPMLVDHNFFSPDPRNYFAQDDPRVYTNAAMYRSITNLTEALGPLVAHYHLRQTNTTQSRALKSVDMPRLLVNKGICIAMTVLFGCAMLISGWALIASGRTFGVWYRDPATVLGSMITFYGNSMFNLPTSNFGPKSWTQSNYNPIALSRWLRILFITYTLSLIISASITLRISQDNIGLVAVSNSSLPIWWTSLPAMFMLLVSLYTTSSDTAVRDLAILSNVSTRPSSIKELDISLLDMLGIRALYTSISLRIYSATLLQALAILCGVLTTLSTLLFSSEIILQHTGVSFSQKGWLGYYAQTSEYQALDSLLLMRHTPNFTWPESTYEDMLFPTIDSGSIQEDKRNTRYSVKLDTRAARLTSTCTQYSTEELTTTVTSKKSPSGSIGYNALISSEYTCPNGTTTTMVLFDGTWDRNMTQDGWFAQYQPTPYDDLYPCGSSLWPRTYKPWLSQLYIWGRDDLSNMRFNHISYWSCNYTWSEIPTEVNLVWQEGQLQIDPSKPPVPDTSRTQPLNPQFNIKDLSDHSPDITLPGVSAAFGPRFSYLIEPFGPLKLDSFSNSSQDTTVINEITYSLGVSAAQHANTYNRLSIDQFSAVEPFQPGILEDIPASITDHNQYRLVQNPGMTVAIVVILSLAFLINIWALISAALRYFYGRRSFLLDLELKGMAPNCFNSIEMLQNLLQGSNVQDLIPSNAERIPPSTLYSRLSWIRFQMGWFSRRGTEERRLTIGALQDEKFQFLGRK